MNLYKVTATFNGKTTEIQVRTSSRRAAITRASLHLIPLDNKRDKAEVSFACEFVKSLPREKKSDTILMDPAKCEAFEMPCKAAATKLIEMKIRGG